MAGVNKQARQDHAENRKRIIFHHENARELSISLMAVVDGTSGKEPL
jgi:hypothetical protein